MISKQPKTLYRYQGFSSKTIELLCLDKLYFSDPVVFNDPLDCQPSIKSDSDINTLRLILKTIIKKLVHSETIASLQDAYIQGDEAAAHAKELSEKISQNELNNIAHFAANPEAVFGLEEVKPESDWLISSIQRALLKQYGCGICCFASEKDNPLLWSHYGDQHRGLCIGYSLIRNPKPEPYEVIYGGNRTVPTSLVEKALLKNDAKSVQLLQQNILLRKAQPWDYEKEWRIFGDIGIQASPLLLTDITFGLRCSKAVMYSVISTLKSRKDIMFYQMYEVFGSFQLKRRPIDTMKLYNDYPNISMSRTEMFGEFTFPPENK